MEEGEPVYASMKITRMEGDDNHIIIGVNNVDAQMKRQEELETVRSEQITYSRVTALAGDFLCIYTVDPETGSYVEYSGSEMYDHLGLSKEGEDFFGKVRSEAGGTIYLEDIDSVVSMVTRDNMLRIIGDKGVFAHDYRLMIKGVPTHVRLKAAMVREKDGDKIIVAVINIDDQVRREQEYTCNLTEARNRAHIDALTGVKNKHAYIDIESELNYQIEENLPVKFALAVFDINELKRINDNEGHQAGDEYIRSACKIICNIFKHSPVFRIGGDEFVIIAQGQDYDNIHSLVAEVEESNAKNAASGDVVVACGVAVYEGDRSVAAVFERADMSMYINKNNLKSGADPAEADMEQ
jgi:diguanylate cyclase (GGDEF)-like protein